MMDYEEVGPPAALRGMVRCFWVLSSPPRGTATPDPALPDGSPELIFNLGAPVRARGASGRLVAQPGAMLVGQITRPFTVAPTGRMRLIAARLTPSGGAWFHDNLAALTDTWMALPPPWEAVRDALAAADTRAQAIARLGEALTQTARNGTGPDPRAARAAALIVASHGATAIADIARQVGLTTRHLQRLFRSQVGVSPKQLARMRRFQRVFAAWRDGGKGWSGVALRAGYFDQAHLIRDFNAFAGGAPAGLLAALPEFTRLFTPLHVARHAASVSGADQIND